MTTFSSGSVRRYGRNFRSERRWWRQWSSASSASTASAASSGTAAHSSGEEEELGLERRGLLPQPRDERAARRVGHVRREEEVRVGQRPDDRRLDPLVLGDRLGERLRVELGDLPVVALAERGGVRLGLRDVGLDAWVVGPVVEVAEVPRDLLGARQLGRRHSPESSCTESSARVTGARHANRSQT